MKNIEEKKFSDYPTGPSFDEGSSDIREQLKILIFSVEDSYFKNKGMSRREVFKHFIAKIETRLEEAQKEAVKKLVNDIKLEITQELNRSIKADSSATAVILEVDKAINRVLRNSEEKPSTGI